MIIGIGADIIEIHRVTRAMESKGFVKRCFTPDECRILASKGPAAAVNFAGKEAVAKALGTGFRGFGPGDVEILRDAMGKPYVQLYNGAKRLADDRCIQHIHISLSHCQAYAVAYVVAESTKGDDGK